MRNLLFVALGFLLSIPAAEIHARDFNVPYGQWVQFSKGEVLSFSDFDLRFIGTAENAPYPGQTERRLAEIFRFEIGRSDKKQVVSWSAGTGDVGPVRFEAFGSRYFIELVHSSVLGRAPGARHLVIWKESDYLSRVNSR